jgi:uncharacterized protein YciI
MKTGLLLLIATLTSSYVFGQSSSYSFVFLNKKADAVQLPKEEGEKLMAGHMANIERLAKEGKLIVAGPFEGGGGIFIFNTTSIDEAKSWLDTDPGVKANRWEVEIFPYRPRVNSVCIAKEPYEMVTYQFIRFTANKSKSTARDYPQIFYKHDDYLKEIGKKANVVTEGIFGEFDGGILIINGDLPVASIESDPAIQEGLLTLDVKKLWIAKGSFCEDRGSNTK